MKYSGHGAQEQPGRDMVYGKRFVYMNHAATTRTHPAVITATLPCTGDRFGNPSSTHGIARETREAGAEAPDGLPAVKRHCSVLAGDGIHPAINDYRKKHGLPAREEKPGAGHVHHGAEEELWSIRQGSQPC
jgi:hypothetical protein